MKETTNSIHQGCTVGDLAVQAIGRDRERVALVQGDQQFTYRELGDGISQMIQVLKSHGLKRGDGLAMLSINRPEVLFVSLAVNIMGVRYTPLHPLGSEEDHSFILEDAEISILVVDNVAYAERGKALEESAPDLKAVLTFGASNFGKDISAEMSKFTPRPLQVEAQPTDICNVQYTGGTTGKPKGVILPHRSLVAARMTLLTDFEFPEHCRFLAATPISHVAGGMVLPVLLRGGTVYLETKFDPEGFLTAIEKHKITNVFLVPTMIYVLLDYPGIKDFDFSSLKTIAYGAAPMSPTRIVEALDVFGPIFIQGYGQTEAPVLVSALRKNDHDPNNLERLGSCGTPVAGVQLKILDENHNEVPMGEIGEICIRGPQVMDGYWKRPDETAQVFRGAWLHTGIWRGVMKPGISISWIGPRT